MITNRLFRQILLISLFMLLQLGGQTAAGFSGREAGFLNLYTLISYTCLLARAMIWILILRELPLTAAYPFTGAVYLLILPLSMLIFGESPQWSRFAGAALIFCGIIINSAGAARNA